MASRSAGEGKLDKLTAEALLKDNVVHKDFWAVNDYQDNTELLQSLIDILFNSIEGNDYLVKYQENQNGTRLIITCKICCKDLSSYDPFMAHENGKPHKKVMQKSLSKVEISVDSLQLQPHNKPRGIFPEGSLENMIDTTNFSVLGMQFVFKEVIDGRDTFTCQLCQEDADVHQLPASRMFSHLTSKGHNLKYLKVKFGYVKKSHKDFEEECLAIEEFEGKIHANIVDLTIESEKSQTLFLQPALSPKEEKIPKFEPPERNSEMQDSSKPETCDVGVSANMTSEARFIMNELHPLQDVDCLMVLQDDNDMQDLLKETLWNLACKMEKYYNRTGATFTDGTKKTPLSDSAEKVKQYVAELAELN